MRRRSTPTRTGCGSGGDCADMDRRTAICVSRIDSGWREQRHTATPYAPCAPCAPRVTLSRPPKVMVCLLQCCSSEGTLHPEPGTSSGLDVVRSRTRKKRPTHAAAGRSAPIWRRPPRPKLGLSGGDGKAGVLLLLQRPLEQRWRCWLSLAPAPLRRLRLLSHEFGPAE